MWLLQRLIGVWLGWYQLPHRETERCTWLTLVAILWSVGGVVAPITIWRNKAWGYFLEMPVLAPWTFLAWAEVFVAMHKSHPIGTPAVNDLVTLFVACMLLSPVCRVFKAGIEARKYQRTAP